MTYGNLLRRHVGKKGRLIPTQGTYLFRLDEHENAVLSEVHDGFAIILMITKEETRTRAIPLTLLCFDREPLK